MFTSKSLVLRGAREFGQSCDLLQLSNIHPKKHFQDQYACIFVRFREKPSSCCRPQSKVCGMKATSLSHLFALHLSSTLLTLYSAGLGLKDVPDLLPKARPPPHPADMAEDTHASRQTHTHVNTVQILAYLLCVFKHVGLVMLMCVILTLEHTQEQTHSWNVDAATGSGPPMTERQLARSFAPTPRVRRRHYRSRISHCPPVNTCAGQGSLHTRLSGSAYF